MSEWQIFLKVIGIIVSYIHMWQYIHNLYKFKNGDVHTKYYTSEKLMIYE
jgi:hypothetical protein